MPAIGEPEAALPPSIPEAAAFPAIPATGPPPSIWDTYRRHDRPSQPAAAPAGPKDTAPFPHRAPGGHQDGTLPPVWGASGQRDDAPLPHRDPGGLQEDAPESVWDTLAQESASALPRRFPGGQQDGTPAQGTHGQQAGSPRPARGTHGQQAGSPLPVRGTDGHQAGSPLPTRGSRDQAGGSILPVRRTRYRRAGRHSSPHQLSLPSDSPALVIAVPGSARPEAEEVAIRVAELAASSCQGAEVRVGYLRGNRDLLDDVLADVGTSHAGLAGVVVPLLPFPHPETDEAIAESVTAASAPFLTAAHLGPHPLLAEALHARLADASLARASRVGRISIVTAADGVIVGAAGDDEALEGAGVVAVLLASRLTMPVAAASLTDPSSIKDAANRLRDARVDRVILAPCMVGPELTSGTLDAIAALTSTEYAPPLGSHPAIGQLVAIRYGAALADPKVATAVAEARGEPLPASAPPPAG